MDGDEKAKAELSKWPARSEIDAEIRGVISEQQHLDELKRCATLLSEQEAAFHSVMTENSAIAEQERPDANGLHDRLTACGRKLQLAKSLARTAESIGQAEAKVAELSTAEDQSSTLETLKTEGTAAHERMNKVFTTLGS